MALIDIALIIELFENLLNSRDVPLIRGADKIIMADVHQLPELADSLNDAVHIFLGFHTGVFRHALDFLAMLVCSCQEHDIVAGLSFETRKRVRRNGGIGMPDMQLVARVVDGRRDVVLFHKALLRFLL